MPELRRLLVADDPASWAKAGFSIDGGTTSIGAIGVRFVPSEPVGANGVADRSGVIGWELTDVDDGSIDGLWSLAAPDEPTSPTVVHHPNRVSRIDHVVINTPDVRRTVDALRGFGFSPRRTVDVPGTKRRQVFMWAGEAILEIVGPSPDPAGPSDPASAAPAAFWGLAMTTDDMEAAVAALGPMLSSPKDAVQPGRQIATVKTDDLGMGTALAFMTPHVRQDAPHGRPDPGSD